MALGPNAEKYLTKVKDQVEKIEQIVDDEIDSRYTGSGSIQIVLPVTPYEETKSDLRNKYLAVGWKSVDFSRSTQYNEETYYITLSTLESSTSSYR